MTFGYGPNCVVAKFHSSIVFLDQLRVISIMYSIRMKNKIKKLSLVFGYICAGECIQQVYKLMQHD